ncbi:MAG: hypothetical protein DRJ60_05140 [Thermoprotei archaeon]|nr:MAG: hypothetical protein DRJ60_05140 [Thermoprotei archaeon]
MAGAVSESKLWSLAWRVCKEISAKLDINPYDFMAALLLEAAAKNDLLIAWVLYGYFGIDMNLALEVTNKIKEMLHVEISSNL